MPDWRKYRRVGWIEMRPYIAGEDLSKVSVSATDQPRVGGFVARNPLKTDNQWYVAPEFARDNYVCMD